MRRIMQRAVGAVAIRAGLVSRAKADQLASSLELARAKIAELKDSLEQARQENRTWKAKFEEATKRYRESHDEDSARAAKRAAKYQEELERLREREEKHRARIAELQEKATGADRTVRIAREQLMAIEVKLDIVEGALNVLDSRTRAALAASDRTSKPLPQEAGSGR